MIGVACGLWPGALHAQSAKAARAMVIVASSLNVADLASTLTTPGTEINPLVPNRKAVVVGKGVTAPVYAWSHWRQAEKHPKLVFWSAVALSGAFGWATWHNLSLR